MGILCPVILPATCVVPPRNTKFAQRKAVGSELVGHDGGSSDALLLREFSHQLERRLAVSPWLNEDVQGPRLSLSTACQTYNCLPLRRRARELLRDPNWLLGSGFCRSRCWPGYHNRIGNRLRNIDGFRAGLMSTNHARPP